VGAGDAADREAVKAGHHQAAVRGAFDHPAVLGQGVGQVALLHCSDVDARGGVLVDELLGAGVGDDATLGDDEQVIGGLGHLAHEMA
jgi:hypothetical protein